MFILYLLCMIMFIISFVIDQDKTKKACINALNMFLKVLPSFLLLICIMSITMCLIPPSIIAELMGSQNEKIGMVLGSILGSMVVMPGFIVFPLAGILLKEGVSLSILASFTTTLMMVGILTLPIEIKYFGKKLAIIRNVNGYIIAMIVSVVIGLWS